MQSDKTTYKKQQKLSLAQFFAELPNFIVLTISAILTGSPIVWVDFLDSLGNVLRTGTTAALTGHLTRDLQYEYNYGVSRIENIAVLLCDSIVMCGLAAGVVSSVSEIIQPHQPSDLLIYVSIIKIINTVLDACFLKEQWNIRKTDSSMLAQSNYTAAVGMLLFDAVALISILLVSVFRNSTWTWYFSPVISILIGAYLAYKCVNRLRRAVWELTDKTLPEEEQMKILKVITRHYEAYSEFHFVKSHKLGDKAHIELVLSFPGDTQYCEMLVLKNALQEEISELIKDCTVSISIA